MAVDPLRRHEAGDRLLVGLVAIDHARRHPARPDDLAPSVDIHQKGVERARPLLDAAFELAPFGLGENPREHVERNEPVGIAALAIDREGDADAAEERLGLGLLHLAKLRGHLSRPVAELRVMGPDPVIVEHLVEERCIHADPRPTGPDERLGSGGGDGKANSAGHPAAIASGTVFRLRAQDSVAT